MIATQTARSAEHLRDCCHLLRESFRGGDPLAGADEADLLRRLVQQRTKARAAFSAGNGSPLASLSDEIE